MTTDDRPTTSAATKVIRVVPAKADRDPVGHQRRRRIIETSLAIGFPAALLVLWQVASVQGWVNRTFYPAPTDIFTEMRETFQENPKGNWWVDIGISVRRMLWGYFWGVLVGLAFGVSMGMSRTLRVMLEPTLNALYTVPKLALIGIFLIILGFDDTPLIAVIAVTVFFFVWIQSMAAVMSVSSQLQEAALSFGSSRWQLFRHVVFPASLPQIFVGLRVSAGVGVLVMIGSEFVFAPGAQGVGYRINNARTVFDPLQAYVGLVVSAVLGVVFVSLIKLLAYIALPWSRDHRSS